MEICTTIDVPLLFLKPAYLSCLLVRELLLEITVEHKIDLSAFVLFLVVCSIENVVVTLPDVIESQRDTWAFCINTVNKHNFIRSSFSLFDTVLALSYSFITNYKLELWVFQLLLGKLLFLFRVNI